MRRLILILFIGLLAGCAHFEIGIEPPATPAPRATEVVVHVTETPPMVPLTPIPIVLPTSTATSIPTATRRPAVRPTSILTIQSPTSTATPEGPTILNFSVEPLEVDPGDTVTLRWSVANTDSVDIYQHGPDTVPNYDTVDLSATGEITQTILERERLWHVYELSVPHGTGVVTQAITVAIRCPYTYFFNPQPAEDSAWACPDGPLISSTAAEQVFENGRMVWLQHDDMIYVLRNDGTYRTYEDTWVAGQADTVPGLTPPQGRYMPIRGFGKVWSGDPEMRSSLGWAMASEQGFETQIQGGWIHCCSRLDAMNRPIYLRDVEGHIIRLWPGESPPGQWSWVD